MSESDREIDLARQIVQRLVGLSVDDAQRVLSRAQRLLSKASVINEDKLDKVYNGRGL